jgi:hypothetical protein
MFEVDVGSGADAGHASGCELTAAESFPVELLATEPEADPYRRAGA